MKTFTLLTTLYLIALISISTQAQGELSVMMGIHPYGKIYDMVSGTHTAIQYNMAEDQPMKYGLIAQHSSFRSGEHDASTPQVTSLNGFASYAFVENRRMKSYIKMEMGAAYASTNPGLESRSSSVPKAPAHFMSAEINPAIGAEFKLDRAFTLQLEFKNVLHYGHVEVNGGAYNYSGFDMGITYKFNHAIYNTKPYAHTRPHPAATIKGLE